MDGGWLYGEPNDGDCIEDSDEDRMLFVFNRGGQADSNPVTSRGCGTSRDAAGTETHRALIMKAVDPGENADPNFARVWAREFRYDGPRQRYLARVLDPDTLAPVADQWTDYVGDAAMLDYRFEYFGSGDEERLTGYLPGVSQTVLVTDDTQYFHADHLGSTWYTSTLDTAVRAELDDGSAIGVERRPAESRAAGDFEVTAAATRTAFGETVNADWGIPESRYPGHSAAGETSRGAGYAGAHGYQEHDFASPADPGAPDGYTDARFKASPTAGFPYMHLGWRYYDPGSGRFLQRDPIGIRGGVNVYAYVRSPINSIDPLGLFEQGVGGPYGEGRLGPPFDDYEPDRGSPAQELERIKKDVYLECGISGLAAFGSWWMALPPILAGLIDEALHWDEPLNPLWGGDYSEW